MVQLASAITPGGSRASYDHTGATPFRLLQSTNQPMLNDIHRCKGILPKRHIIVPIPSLGDVHPNLGHQVFFQPSTDQITSRRRGRYANHHINVRLPATHHFSTLHIPHKNATVFGPTGDAAWGGRGARGRCHERRCDVVSTQTCIRWFFRERADRVCGALDINMTCVGLDGSFGEGTPKADDGIQRAGEHKFSIRREVYVGAVFWSV